MSNQHSRDSQDCNPNRPLAQESGSDGVYLSQATYESLANALPLSLIVKDLSGARLFANPAYLKRRGQALEEVVGKRDEDLFPHEIARRYREDDRRVVQSGQSLHDVEETIDREGRSCWIERIKSPIFDSENRIVGVQAIFWDVTQRVSADRELTHERRLLSTLMSNIPDSIYFKDTESRFLRISEAMAAKFGLENAAAAIGKTDADIFTEEHAVAAREDELKIMETGTPIVDLVERETWPDHEDTWCMSTKMPFRDDEGCIIGTFGISRDITKLKRYEDELKEARDAADAANRAKSDFLANMSHEIRTPMNAIIGMSELLSQTELNQEQQGYVNLVRESADSLLQLLNEILDFSKIEAHRLELESIPFSLRNVVEKTAQTLAIRAAERGLELACRIDPDLPDRLVGDPGRLRQILINLIGNAIKFTDDGEVLVEVCRDLNEKFSDDDRIPIRFSVRDTGIGIPAELHAAVLDPFTQADASTTRRFGGTGLGLAISRQLVELMGGELCLDSQPGYGTNFFFTAHLPKADPHSFDAASDLKSLEGLPVLLVDDNATNLRILNEIFSRWKLCPALAGDAEEALRQIGKAERRGQPFRLAVLDCMMPTMDGFELAKRIRDITPSERLKLILLSSATRGDDIERCRKLGISRYLTKPVVQSELLDTILNVMSIRSGRTSSPEPSLPNCPPMRILVAEDGLANQQVAVGMLRAGGHQAVVVDNGRDAVERWRNEPFDLILMDMHMPEMDGVEAARTIRDAESDGGCRIPIIALTAAAMKADVERCQQAGMNAHLSKPIHLRMLHETLARFAPECPVGPMAESVAPHSRQSENEVGSESTCRSPNTSAQESVPSVDGEPPVDLSAAAKRIPGGLSGVRGLTDVFFEECDDLMIQLRQQIPGGDAEVVQRCAHTLKSSAALFSAQSVQVRAQQIEQQAKSGDLGGTDAMLETLEREVALMLAALREFAETDVD